MLILLILVVILPIIGAMFALIFKNRLTNWFAVLFALATAVVGVMAGIKSFPGTYLKMLSGGMPWIKELDNTKLFGVSIDPLSALLIGLVTVMGVLITIYSTEYLSPRNKEHPTQDDHRRYFFWLLIFIGAMVGIAVSPNLLQLFIFWELTTLCSWALISHNHNHDRPALHAGFKALMMTHVGGIFYLIGLFILFIFTKSFDFKALGELDASMRSLVFFLFLMAAWAKAAQIPFHTWLPSAMEAPTPISAYLHAAAMVKAGVYLVARISMETWSISSGMGLVVAIMAMVTMFMALLFYFLQDDLKKLLAYSTIAHLSYILLGISLGIMGSSKGFQGGILHILCHGVAKTTLFLTVGAISYSMGTKKISELGGIARKLPIETFAFFIGAFAVTGIPPFACFWSKFLIFTGAMDIKGVIGPILMVLVIIESVTSFSWFLWVGHKVFFGPPKVRTVAEITSGLSTPEAALAHDPPAIHWVLIALAIACIVVPLVGIPLVQAISVP